MAGGPRSSGQPDGGGSGRIVSVDGLLVFGFGPRIAEAVALLSATFHPGPTSAKPQ